MTISRNLHVVQPYWVGAKEKKSLALIIPAHVIKQQGLDSSTVFASTANSTKIVLKVIYPELDREAVTISTGESFEATNQQIPSSGGQ
jgi:hypothetical protein